ncbi:Transcription factor [Niveomyces insectorum RCEF 264]|uniref:Transcription factor n=1 Tax=Niveomyces insectorum RCEF 264 TaxID=1081102 RepID=A0A167XTG2_9HYPO|nr:Transcription factor [Niveomyces insectorum RCEF 264]
MHACERCHSRKVKCDRRLPHCTSCAKSQAQCHYPNKWRGRQLQQEYLKSVERRLRELEQENARLRDRAAEPSDTPMSGTATTATDAEDTTAITVALVPTEPSQGQAHAIHSSSLLQGPLPVPHEAAASTSTSTSTLALTPVSASASTAASAPAQARFPPPLHPPLALPLPSSSIDSSPGPLPALAPPPPPPHPPLPSSPQSPQSYGRPSSSRPAVSPHDHTSPPPLVTQLSPTRSASSHRTPGEEARYLGSSNGVEFTDVVERVVDRSSHDGGPGGPGDRVFGRTVDERHTYGYGSLAADAHDTADCATNATVTDDAAVANDRVALPRVAHPPTTLVDEAIAMPLVESYFAHWHLTFPLLYRPAFLRMVQDLYAEPVRYQQDAACAFAFDIVLALGAVPAKRRVEWGLGFGDAERHFARALARLDAVTSLRDIRALQALLLYAKYGIHASLRDTSSELWEVLGKATQLVVELGLHQTGASGPTGAAAARLQPRCETHITGPLPAAVRTEMQRRSFWCYYNLETIVNISLGRPLSIHDDDIDVPLPLAADDEEIGLETLAAAADGSACDNSSNNNDNNSNELPSSSSPPSSSSFHPSASHSLFLHHIQYRRLQARIHRCMYTSRSMQTRPLSERQAVRREIYVSLQEWQRGTSRLNLQPQNQPHKPITSSFLHPSWYQALYHSACLMLFRPSTAFPAVEFLAKEHGGGDDGGGGGDGDEDVSGAGGGMAEDPLHILWTASRGVLHRYGELLRSRHFNYSWVSLYTIFMAGLANVYSVGCCAQRRRRFCHGAHLHNQGRANHSPDAATSSAAAGPPSPPFLPSLLDVICDFRDCSNILTAIGERWNDARVPYDTFARLSFSALRELTTVTCRSDAGDCRCLAAAVDCSGSNDTFPSVPANANKQLGPAPPLSSFASPLPAPLPPLATSYAPPFSECFAASGTIAPLGFTAGFSGVGPSTMEDSFAPDHTLTDYYSMVDFQQLFQEM